MRNKLLIALALIALPFASVQADADPAGACMFAQIYQHANAGISEAAWDDDKVYAHCEAAGGTEAQWMCMVDELEEGVAYADAETECGISGTAYAW